MELKDKVVRGVAWSAAEKIGSMLLQMAVSFILAGLLVPEDYGTIAILTVFSTISLLIVDSGYSQALIRKPDPTQQDYTSVFAFNLCASVVLYGILVAASYPLAQYYNRPEITHVAPVLFLVLPVNALCVIQNTILTRKFDFRRLSTITFFSSMIAGIAAIAMALLGAGLWALVWQRVLTLVAKAIMLWLFGSWRPSGRISTSPLRQMAPYSYRLLATDMLTGIYNNVAALFIGRMYTLSQLGYFSQAQKLKDLPVTSTVQAVQNVTFPAMSNITDDEAKFAESFRKVLLVTGFVMIPMMLGLIAVADDMFEMLGQKWMPTVPYFRIFCLTGITTPIAMIAYNTLKVRSNGRIIFRLEIIKKSIMTLMFIITIPISIKAVVWGMAAMSAVEMALTFHATRRYTTLRARRVAHDLLAPTLIAVVMAGCVTAMNLVDQAWHPIARLVAEVPLGAAVYIGLSALFRLEGFAEMMAIVKGLHSKITKT